MLEKLRMQISRGGRAKAALNNEIIKQAFDDVEAEITKGWQNCDPFDEKMILHLKQNHTALMQVKQKLAFYISQGETASKSLKP